MSTRIKTSKSGLASEAAFRATVDSVAEAQLKINILTTKRDKRIQAIRDEYDPEISGTTKERDRLAAAAEAYALEHRDTLLPTERKSGDTGLALWGFRLGNPALKVLNKRWTFEGVLERCRELGLVQYIVTKESLDKDRIKRERQSDEELAEIGCRIEQSDDFFIEPKDVGAKEVGT